MWPITNRTELMIALARCTVSKQSDQVKQHVMTRAHALKATDLLPLKWQRKDAETLLLEAVERSLKESNHEDI